MHQEHERWKATTEQHSGLGPVIHELGFHVFNRYLVFSTQLDQCSYVILLIYVLILFDDTQLRCGTAKCYEKKWGCNKLHVDITRLLLIKLISGE